MQVLTKTTFEKKSMRSKGYRLPPSRFFLRVVACAQEKTREGKGVDKNQLFSFSLRKGPPHGTGKPMRGANKKILTARPVRGAAAPLTGSFKGRVPYARFFWREGTLKRRIQKTREGDPSREGGKFFPFPFFCVPYQKEGRLQATLTGLVFFSVPLFLRDTKRFAPFRFFSKGLPHGSFEETLAPFFSKGYMYPFCA